MQIKFANGLFDISLVYLSMTFCCIKQIVISKIFLKGFYLTIPMHQKEVLVATQSSQRVVAVDLATTLVYEGEMAYLFWLHN